VTLLRPAFTHHRKNEFAAARVDLERTLETSGERSFESVSAQERSVCAWASLHFARPMSSACARTLYLLDSILPRSDVQLLFHGGLIDRRSGRIRRPRWFRYPFAGLSVIYLALAIAGSFFFSGIVLLSSLPLLIKTTLIVVTTTALLGHSVFGFLVLVRSLLVFWRIAGSRLDLQMSEIKKTV